jgi:hypothetical protein
MANVLRIPSLTRTRIVLALAVALVTDGLQLLAGPPGWVLFDQVTDIIAMVLVSALVGFHPLLLPTFVLEFIPLVGMLPTWTGCVAAVVMMRRRSDASPPSASVVQSPPPTQAPPPIKPPGSTPVIDV